MDNHTTQNTTAEWDEIGALLELVKRQQQNLVHGQIDAFVESLGVQMELMSRIKTRERARIKSVSIPEEADSRETFKASRREAIMKIQSIHRQNMILIQRSLHQIRHQIKLLWGNDTGPVYYTKTGDYRVSRPHELLNTTI